MILNTERALAAQLASLQDLLSDDAKAQFFHEAHVFPTSTFPAAQQDMLGVLLRKRLEPDVRKWQDRARGVGIELEDGIAEGDGQEWEALWDWAAPACNVVAKEVFPREEDEEEQDEDSDDEDQKMGEDKKEVIVSGPPMPLSNILKFASMGVMPPSQPPRR